MKRAVLIVGLTAVGLVLLVWLGGGMAGPGAREAEPEIVTVSPPSTTQTPGLTPDPNLALGVTEGQGFNVPAGTKSLTFTDPTSGETVRISDFLPWHIYLSRVKPEHARRPEEQAARAEGVELTTYREPQTLEEARALANAHSADDAHKKLIKWRVTAPWARADFLAGDLRLSRAESRPERSDTRILLGGGVVIHDYEEKMTIECETLEIQPYLDQAKGKGSIVVRHEAFELTGTGLDLQRKTHGTNVTILEEPFARMYGTAQDSHSKPMFDFGRHDLRPGHISSDGPAHLVHDHSPDAAREHLTLEMTENVHAQQQGDPSPDQPPPGPRELVAERLRLFAYRLRSASAETAPSPTWQLQKFEAEGLVILEYPERTKDGKPYRIRAEGQRLLHQVGPEGITETVLEGAPVVTLRGNIPFEGLHRQGHLGLIRARARDRIWLGPAAPIDLPADADPREYRRVRLIGDAEVQYSEAGFDPDEDTIAGDEIRLLLRQLEERDSDPDVDAEPRSSRRVVAVSFDVRGGVQIGGTRMSGQTERLLGRRLDTDNPVLIAEGQGTSFAFHGLRKGERLVGGPEADTAPQTGAEPGMPSSEGSASAKPVWVLQRVHARQDVEIRTSLGGAGLGLPTRVEGEELIYDRVPDQARVRGTTASPARLFVATGGKERHRLVARTMTLDRARGRVEAENEVRGEVYLTGDDADGGGGGLALPEAQKGIPTTLGVATNGRIEVHTRVERTSSWAPRADTEQVIRVEGPLVAELTASSLDEVDTLRAKWLEIALVHTAPAPGGSTTASTTRVSGPFRGERRTARRQTTPDASGGPRAGEPSLEPATRWDIATERLTGRFDAGGFVSLDAEGGVAFRSENTLVGGAAFSFDAQGQRLYVRGGPETNAWARFGPPTSRSDVRASELVVTFDDEGPTHLLARGPANAVLIRADPNKPGGMERFDVACQNDVEVTASQLRTEGLVEIQRFLRAGPQDPWTAPFQLVAWSLTVHGQDLLTRKAADIERIVAAGRPKQGKFAWLRTGRGEDLMMVWGAKFNLDVPTGLATLDGSPERDLRVRRGPADAPTMESDQTRIIINMNTGQIEDLDQMHFILRGGVKR